MEDQNKGGAPALFNKPEDFQKKVEEYFTHIKGERNGEEWARQPEPPTITGLCLFLGFESRQSFYDYDKRDGFSYTVKRARMRIEHEYEKRLDDKVPVGAIFALKNMGWADKQEIKHEGITNPNVTVNVVPPKDED